MRILTLNLGLLCLAIAKLGRIAIDRHAGARLAAAPALLAACNADVLVLQEVYSACDRRHLQHGLRGRYPFVAGSPGSGAPIGAGLFVLSRFPIVDVAFVAFPGGRWARHVRRRGVLIVVIETPHSGRVRLMNVHLSASCGFDHPESGSSVGNRHRELDMMLDLAETLGLDLLVGDFNTGPTISPENYRRVLATGFADAFSAVHHDSREADGVTWDANNPLNATGRFRSSPSQRIDHVFARQGHDAWATSSADIVLRDREIATKRGRICLSDHYGLLVELDRESSILRHGVAEAVAAGPAKAALTARPSR